MKISLLFTAFVAAFLFMGCGDSNEAKTIIEDNTTFEDLKIKSNKTYTLKTTQGKSIVFDLESNVLKSKQLAGKVVVLNFWATWCAPCIQEIPTFNTLYEKHKNNFELIGVLFEKNKNSEELAAFMEKYKVSFPVTVGAENFRLASYFDDIKMVPETYVFSKEGKLLKKFIGIVDEKEFEHYISQ